MYSYRSADDQRKRGDATIRMPTPKCCELIRAQNKSVKPLCRLCSRDDACDQSGFSRLHSVRVLYRPPPCLSTEVFCQQTLLVLGVYSLDGCVHASLNLKQQAPARGRKLRGHAKVFLRPERKGCARCVSNMNPSTLAHCRPPARGQLALAHIFFSYRQMFMFYFSNLQANVATRHNILVCFSQANVAT